MLAQSAGHAHRRGGFDAGDGLPVELVAALDDDRAILGDNRTVGDRSSQRGAEVGELTARGGREDDTVPSHDSRRGGTRPSPSSKVPSMSATTSLRSMSSGRRSSGVSSAVRPAEAAEEDEGVVMVAILAARRGHSSAAPGESEIPSDSRVRASARGE